MPSTDKPEVVVKRTLVEIAREQRHSAELQSRVLRNLALGGGQFAQLAEQAERLRAMAEGPLSRALHQLGQNPLANIVELHLARADELQRLTRGFSAYFDFMNTGLSRLTSTVSLSTSLQLAALRALPMTSLTFPSPRQDIIVRGLFENIEDLAGAVSGEDNTPMETADAIVEALKPYLEKIAHPELGWVGMLAILGAVVSILQFLIYFLADNGVSQMELDEAIGRLEVGFQEQIEDLAKRLNDTSKLVVLRRATNLRAAPRKNGRLVGILHVNQPVVIKEQYKEWVYVQFWDYGEGEWKEGWAIKKYMVPHRIEGLAR